MLHSPITSVLSWAQASRPVLSRQAGMPVPQGVISSRSLAFLKGIENFHAEEVVARAALETSSDRHYCLSKTGRQQLSGGSATKFFCSLAKEALSSRWRFNLNNSSSGRQECLSYMTTKEILDETT